MKKIILLASIWCFAFYSNAQNHINVIQHWFDIDYAHAVTQNISPVTVYNFNGSIDASSLSTGLHTFHFRAKDDSGRWSVVQSQYFIKNPSTAGGSTTITSYEYWFDNDYANKVTQNGTGTQILNMNTGLSVNNLSKGLHTLHIRFKDGGGSWSVVESQYFFNAGGGGVPNVITGYRYWFNQNSSQITENIFPVPSKVTNALLTLNASYLKTGMNVAHIQFKDIYNNWSVVVTDTMNKLGKPRLDYINPTKGGNTGDVTVNVYGTGFYNGTRVMLVHSGDTIKASDSLTFISYGQTIQATLNLRNKSLGFYDVVVITPYLNGDTTMKILNGFEIIEGIAAKPWSNIVGFSSIRVNQWQSFTLTVGNNGNVDATGLPVWLALPPNVLVDFNFTLLDPSYPAASVISYDTVSSYFSVDSVFDIPSHSRIYGFIISRVPPNGVKTMNFKLKSTSSFEIKTWVNKPLYASPLDPQTSECLEWLFKEASQIGTPELYKCFFKASDNIVTIFKDNPYWSPIWGGTGNPDYGSGSYILNYSKSLGGMVLTCLTAVAEPTGQLENVFKLLHNTKALREGIKAVDMFTKCSPSLVNAGQIINSSVRVVTSYDPNEKLGPVGSGIKHFYSSENPFTYSIHFENADTATAPAQTVTIIDTLDKTKMDLSTLEFSFIKIADTIINISEGLKQYSGYIDLRPKRNFIVKVDGDLNESTGVLTWHFQTLDPLTLQPITNPIEGFLPPNKIAPEGEGAVFFTIKAKQNIPNNTVVTNIAHICFDNNACIITNEWMNTVDNIKPHSKVNALTAYQYDTTFTVSWSGIDTSSGILNYSVYYAENNGSYKLWKLNTDETSSQFTGKLDSTYRFYSIATDSALNKEVKNLLPDATTTIVLPTGIDNDLRNYGFNIYPNPNGGSFKIQFLNPQSKDAIIVIANSIGQIIYSEKNELSKTNSVRISLNNILSGIYSLQIISKKGVQIKMIVIAK